MYLANENEKENRSSLVLLNLAFDRVIGSSNIPAHKFHALDILERACHYIEEGFLKSPGMSTISFVKYWSENPSSFDVYGKPWPFPKTIQIKPSGKFPVVQWK